MDEIKTKENQWRWICRILFSIDIILLLSGYLSMYQAWWQLKSPLIPKSTMVDIVRDSRLFEASTGAGILLLAGLWFYSFNRYKTAIALLAAAIPVSWLIREYLYR